MLSPILHSIQNKNQNKKAKKQKTVFADTGESFQRKKKVLEKKNYFLN